MKAEIDTGRGPLIADPISVQLRRDSINPRGVYLAFEPLPHRCRAVLRQRAQLLLTDRRMPGQQLAPLLGRQRFGEADKVALLLFEVRGFVDPWQRLVDSWQRAIECRTSEQTLRKAGGNGVPQRCGCTQNSDGDGDLRQHGTGLRQPQVERKRLRQVMRRVPLTLERVAIVVAQQIAVLWMRASLDDQTHSLARRQPT